MNNIEKNLKISDILSVLKEGKNIKDCGIKTIPYLDIEYKIGIIKGFENDENSLIKKCLYTQNGITYIDYFFKEIFTAINIIIYYTNITILEEENIYNTIMESGIYKYVICHIPVKEIEQFEYFINKALNQEVENANSIQNLTYQILQELLKKIPSDKQIKNMIKKFENLDLSNLKTIKDLYNFSKNN